jgi:hypothetical protein
MHNLVNKVLLDDRNLVDLSILLANAAPYQ